MRYLLRKIFSNKQTEERPHMKMNVFSSLDKNIEFIENQLFHSSDLKRRSIRFNHLEGLIVFFESLTDQQRIQNEIIQPIEEKREGNVDKVITSLEITKTIGSGRGSPCLNPRKMRIVIRRYSRSLCCRCNCS